MAVARSPNYPSMDLGTALESVRPALKAEHRNKMSRQVLAKHLGYSSLNGRALGKIGAVRAYGLLEGAGDELRVSEDAIYCLEAPEDDPGRAAVLGRCAVRPSIFGEIAKEFATLPSGANLRFWLVKQGYTPEAAGKAAQTYLATMRLVAGASSSYNPSSTEEESEAPPPAKVEVGDMVTVERDGVLIFPGPVRVREITENGGATWVWTDGAASWTELETVTVFSKAASPPKPPPPPAPAITREEAPLLRGIRKAVFPLSEGDVTVTFPEGMSADSHKLLSAYLALFFNSEGAKAPQVKTAVDQLAQSYGADPDYGKF